MSEERRAERGSPGSATSSGERPHIRSVGADGAPVPAHTEGNDDEEIAVEEGDPEGGAPKVVILPDPPPRASQLPQFAAKRGRMTLRIPDDEVARPSSPPADAVPARASAPSLAASTTPSGLPIPPSRIITINPPPGSPRAPSAPSLNDPQHEALAKSPRGAPAVRDSRPPDSDVPTLAREGPSRGPKTDIGLQPDDSWTPYQPAVDDGTRPREHVVPDDATLHDVDPDASADSVEIPFAREPRDHQRPATSPSDPLARTQRMAPSSPDIPVETEDFAETPPPPEASSALPPMRAPASTMLDSEEVKFDSEPPVPSETGDLAEVSPDDFVSVESAPQKSKASPASLKSPPKLAQPLTPAPVAPTPVTPSTPPRAPPKGPLVIVPPHVAPSPLAPPPMSAEAAARKRARPWWEDLFNDDFIRTMAKISDAQIATEADFIEDSLGVAKGAMVLDLGCGTGRHAIELSRRGYQVVGFDLSLSMLARAADEAQERDQKINFVQGDMRDMSFEETFDGVYCWNTTFGFFEEEKNAQVVSNVRRSLKAGGQFLLDVANRDYIMRQSPSLAWFEGDGCVCMDEMHIDWITSRMRVKRTMMMDDGRTKEIEYSIRVYSLHELGKLLHDHGFRVAEVSGRTATPGVFVGCDSPRTLILAEKR